jgi:predicted O-linked N-acetylglucosamine transferase (SPINDLY family)
MTTCEALWMGAPVVSLAGPAFYERLGHSLLTNSGLADLSTDSPDAFVARAVALAGEPERLRAWRAGGRDAMMAGPLGDMEAFAQDFFAAALSRL